MSIDISKAQDGQFYSFSETHEVDKSVFGDRLAEFKAPAVISGSYVVDGANVYVNSHIDADIAFKCDKCLDAADRHLRIRFDATFAPDGTGDYPYKSFTLDFADAVAEQIMLNMPSRVLCKPDCKGLCPICGARLNETSCDCKAETAERENPFSALKDFFNN